MNFTTKYEISRLKKWTKVTPEQTGYVHGARTRARRPVNTGVIFDIRGYGQSVPSFKPETFGPTMTAYTIGRNL